MIDWRQILVLLLIFVPLERLVPLRPGQARFRDQWANDSVHLLLNAIIVRAALAALLVPLLPLFAAMLPAGLTGWVARQPLWIQAPAAIIVADLGFYAHHRLFHAVPFLWRFHAVHHSIKELDWLAAHRVHPFDQLVSSTFSLLPLLALGFSSPAITIYAFVYLLQAHFIHANVRLTFGRLEAIIAGPRFHHWHHADHPEAHDRNFAGQLAIIDRLFGTLRLPATMPDRYGIADPVPRLYPAQLVWPLLPVTPAPAATPVDPR